MLGLLREARSRRRAHGKNYSKDRGTCECPQGFLPPRRDGDRGRLSGARRTPPLRKSLYSMLRCTMVNARIGRPLVVPTAGHQLQIVLRREQLTADLAQVCGMPRILRGWCDADVFRRHDGDFVVDWYSERAD
jgi:hypothetical protein